MSAHHDEQQDIENAKHLWKNGGKWVFIGLVIAALGYLGNVIYQGHMQNINAQAAEQASHVKGDTAKLAALQQQYADSVATIQATLETAYQLFQMGKLDEAAAAYQWVLSHNKTPIFQAEAVQNLANVYLQQKKYDAAHQVLSTPVDTAYQAVLSEIKGDVYAAQGKNKEAAEAYQFALDKLPEHSPSRELLELKAGQL